MYVLLFFLTGFIGWIVDTAFRSALAGTFSNGSAFHIPFLPIYGFGAVLVYALRKFFPKNIFLRILTIGVLLAMLEYLSGVLCFLFLHRRLWTYYGAWNVGGFTDVTHILLWGVLGYLFLRLMESKHSRSKTVR